MTLPQIPSNSKLTTESSLSKSIASTGIHVTIISHWDGSNSTS